MRPEATGGKALRHAALQLHSLSDPDREWMLSSLSPVRRARLEVLLAELRSLGIPADMPLPIHPEVAGAQDRPAPGSDDAPFRRLQHLSAADLDWLAARLHEEPPQVAALVVSAPHCAWREALIGRLDDRRTACIAASATSPVAPLTQAAVLEALGQMLPVPGSSGVSRPAPRWWRRWT
jgi:hypothetical protein